MDFIFIARKYYLSENGSRFYDEEVVFNSFEQAHKYIITISEEDDDYFISEIVSCPIGYQGNFEDYDDYQDVFTFDRKGKLIIENKASDRYNDFHIVETDGERTLYRINSPESYTGKYKAGDIVIIKSYPWKKRSPTYRDKIGVVIVPPLTYDEWRLGSEEPYGWDNAYVVEVIMNGYLSHYHVVEEAMEFYNIDLPESLMFLKILSNHYKGIKTLPRTILEEIEDKNIFVENVKHFDFKAWLE